MTDKIGRKIDYLRVSLTEECNLRCVYCMPVKKKSDQGKIERLSMSEIKELARLFSSMGIRKVRLTGGEPLLREDLAEIIQEFSKYDSIDEIGITTNGINLSEKILSLKNSGLKSVNISLDTLNPERYKNITRGGDISSVLESVEKSLKLGLKVKLNCVISGIQNFDEILELAEFTMGKEIDLRFIELMPIGLGREFKAASGSEILKLLQEKFKLENLDILQGTGKYYKIPSSKGRVGFINPMSETFCKECNKVRITSSCFLKSCLSSDRTLDLRNILQMEISEQKKIELISEFIAEKEEKNCFWTDRHETLHMYEIGG